MAINLQTIKKRNLSSVVMISRQDDALDWDSELMDFEEYKQTLDESKLALIEGKEPTRFVCNFDLKDKDERAIKNNLMKGTDENGKPTIAFGDWAAEITRRCLKEIQQPESLSPMEMIPWKRDGQLYVGPETMAVLHKAGIVEEIFAQYSKTKEGVKGHAKN